jgi:hypothetical protein
MSNDITIAIHLEVTGHEQVRAAMTQAARDVQGLGASIKAVAGDIAANTEHLFQQLGEGADQIAEAYKTVGDAQDKVAESTATLAEALQKTADGAKNLATATKEAADGTEHVATAAEEAKKHIEEVKNRLKELGESGEAIKKAGELFAPLVEKSADVAKEAENAKAKLEILLNGNGRGEEAKEIGEFAEHVSKLTAMPAKVPVLESISRLTDYNVPLEQIKQLEAGMIGISRTRPGADLGTVSEAVGNAAGSGDFGQLKTWLHISDEQIAKLKELKDAGASQGERQAYVTEVLTAQFTKLGLHARAGLSEAQIAENELKLSTEELSESTGTGVNVVQQCFERLKQGIIDTVNEVPALAEFGGGVAYIGSAALSTIGGITTFITQLGNAKVAIETLLPMVLAKTQALLAGADAENAADAAETASAGQATQEQVALNAEKAGAATVAAETKSEAASTGIEADESEAAANAESVQMQVAAEEEKVAAVQAAAALKTEAAAQGTVATETESEAAAQGGILAQAAAEGWGALTVEQAQAAEAALANAGAQGTEAGAEGVATGAAAGAAEAQGALALSQGGAAESAAANTIAQRAQSLAMTQLSEASLGAKLGVAGIAVAAAAAVGAVAYSIGQHLGWIDKEQTYVERLTSGWYRLSDAILGTSNVLNASIQQTDKDIDAVVENKKAQVLRDVQDKKISQQDADKKIHSIETEGQKTLADNARRQADDAAKKGDTTAEAAWNKSFVEHSDKAMAADRMANLDIKLPNPVAPPVTAPVAAPVATAPAAIQPLTTSSSQHLTAISGLVSGSGGIATPNTALGGTATDVVNVDAATKAAAERVNQLREHLWQTNRSLEEARKKQDKSEEARLQALKDQLTVEEQAAARSMSDAGTAAKRTQDTAKVEADLAALSAKSQTDIQADAYKESLKSLDRAEKRHFDHKIKVLDRLAKEGLIDSDEKSDIADRLRGQHEREKSIRDAKNNLQEEELKAQGILNVAEAEAKGQTGAEKEKTLGKARIEANTIRTIARNHYRNAMSDVAEEQSFEQKLDSGQDSQVLLNYLHGGGSLADLSAGKKGEPESAGHKAFTNYLLGSKGLGLLDGGSNARLPNSDALAQTLPNGTAPNTTSNGATPNLGGNLSAMAGTPPAPGETTGTAGDGSTGAAGYGGDYNAVPKSATTDADGTIHIHFEELVIRPRRGELQRHTRTVR